jgi:hypothetical protein
VRSGRDAAREARDPGHCGGQNQRQGRVSQGRAGLPASLKYLLLPCWPHLLDASGAFLCC